jgi:hypothetical protein
MKWFSIILFLLLQTSVVGSKWLLVLEYTIHQDFISSSLCEKRDTAPLDCRGKCQLRKKMAAEENNGKSNQGTQTAKASTADTLFTNELPSIESSGRPALVKLFFDQYLFKIYTAPSFSIFHPPLV